MSRETRTRLLGAVAVLGIAAGLWLLLASPSSKTDVRQSLESLRRAVVEKNPEALGAGLHSDYRGWGHSRRPKTKLRRM